MVGERKIATFLKGRGMPRAGNIFSFFFGNIEYISSTEEIYITYTRSVGALRNSSWRPSGLLASALRPSL